MDIETLDVAGIKFVSAAPLAFGDYDNSCEVERANVRFLKEKYNHTLILMGNVNRSNVGGISPDAKLDWREYTDYMASGWVQNDARLADLTAAPMLIAVGGYGCEQAWIRADIDEQEGYLAKLADYPCLDDDLCSIVKEEMVQEAWDSWLETSLRSALGHADFDADEVSSADLREAAYAVMGDLNLDFQVESGGVYLDTGGAFIAELKLKLEPTP